MHCSFIFAEVVNVFSQLIAFVMVQHLAQCINTQGRSEQVQVNALQNKQMLSCTDAGRTEAQISRAWEMKSPEAQPKIG